MLIDFRFDEDVDDQYGILTATRSDIYSVKLRHLIYM